MNANIEKTHTFHKMKYDLKGHSISHKIPFYVKNIFSSIYFCYNLIVSKLEMNTYYIKT